MTAPSARVVFLGGQAART